MSKLAVNTGVETSGDEINWKVFDDRSEDTTITALMKDFNSTYININNLKSVYDDNVTLNDYIEQFNIVAEKFKFRFTINNNQNIEEEKGKKNKKKIEKKKADLIIEKNKENDKKKKLNDFVNSLAISKENMPISNTKYIESFFSNIIWALNLKYQFKKIQKDLYSNKKIDISIYINCCTSLYRAIEDSKEFLTEINIEESLDLLKAIEIIISSIRSQSIYEILDDNLLVIIDSYWDKIKPKSIQLYPEQKEAIELVSKMLDKKMIVKIEIPPANGKTVNSIFIAKYLSHINKQRIKLNPSYRRKTLLYICYNSIVRNEVGKLCNTPNIDVPFWLAINKVDKFDGIRKTFVRPHRRCYPDWRQKKMRSEKEDARYKSNKWKKYSGNIHDQVEFAMNETRRICEQNNDLDDYLNAENLPEIIICDPNSGYELLKAFPDLFITFYDEPLAAAKEPITAMIMSVLGSTYLVSANLAEKDEIPRFFKYYEDRHCHIDDSYLHIIKSNKQHISCTFVDSKGYILTPHDKINDIESLVQFIPLLEIPLIRRSYSPEVLFNISKIIDSEIPYNLMFRNKFPFIGMLTHESMRDYVCEILTFIANTKDEKLFNILKGIKIQKIKDMDINKIFTESAINYQTGNTLHVSISEGFNDHIENISNTFLEGSPKIKNILTVYEKNLNKIQGEIKSLEKNGNIDSEYERIQLNQELSNLKLEWTNLYVINSLAHANRFGNKELLKNENLMIYPTKDELETLDQVRAKLLFSSIGVYQPESFNDLEMNFFMNRKDNFRFILSTPEIVYGTNISLSIIDIDSKFLQYCTKNILYQLIGRAGRKGKSHSAMIIFRDDGMFQMILEQSNKNIEAEEVEDNFKMLFP